MSPEVIRGASPSGIDIAYERFGDRDAPPVLLVMGLATQMLGWPEEFCLALVARGLHVIQCPTPARSVILADSARSLSGGCG